MKEVKECTVDYNSSVNQTIKEHLLKGWKLLKMKAFAYKTILTFKKN